MTVFRWVMLVLCSVSALASIVSFAVFMGSGIELWVGRARVMRRWFSAFALFWFNVEVWGRVVWILIHW